MGQRRLRPTLGAVAVLCTGIAAACSSFDSEDAPGPTGSDGGSDGAVNAPSTPDSAVDAGAENLVANGSFDVDCSSWNAAQATKEWGAPGRNGGAACKFCSSNDGSWSAYGTVKGPALPGRTYRGRAWVRVPPDASAPPSLFTFFQVRRGGPQVQITPASAGPTLDTTWKQASDTIAINADGGGDLLEFVISSGGDGGCFELDDVVVELEP